MDDAEIILDIFKKEFFIRIYDLEHIIDIFDNLLLELDYSIDNDMEKEKDSFCKKQSPKIFISHSSSDKDYVQALVELLEDIGVNENQLFCSSFSEYGILLNEDIYEYLKTQFEEYTLHVIFILSEEYYKSVACLNEMGATWVLQSSYTTILLPKFEFKNIRGAINPNRISIKLDDYDTAARLNELKNTLLSEFNIIDSSQTKWERQRNEFINKVRNISK